MEVTPEIYAWLINLGIVDGNKSLKMKKEGGIILPENITERLLQGVYMDRILINLEEGYNKFYKLKLNYTDKIKEMKIPKGEEIVPNSVKYHNWKILADVILNFGIEFEDEKISKLIGGNKATLVNLLKSIYTLSSELMKRSLDPGQNNSMLISGGKNKTINTINSVDKSLRNLTNTNQAANTTTNKLNKANLNNTTETIDLNNFDSTKEYSQCESPLEFFIISLCRNLNMKARQSIALLSNNRKYLIHICNKGIKHNFEKINYWYDDMRINMKTLTMLIKTWKDAKAIVYAIVSAGFYSKNYHVALNTFNLVNMLQGDVGSDWDWFVKEGLDAMIYTICKHSDLRVSMINLIYEFSKKKLTDLTKCLNSKLIQDEGANKEKLFEFLGSIVTHASQANPLIYSHLKNYLIESCLAEVADKASSVSLLSDAWVYFDQLENNTVNSILNYLKKSTREKGKLSLQIVSISQLFRLLKHFGDIKDEKAPPIYKTLVFLFLESYDNVNLREFYLNNFSSFFRSDVNIPINILIEPYFRQLKSATNFDLSDFQFLTMLLEHPRLDSDNIIDILDFIFSASLTNINYYRSANLLLHLIFDKNLIAEKHYRSMIWFVKNSLKIFTDSLKHQHLQIPPDTTILETAYDLVSMGVTEINESVHKDIVESVQYYRGELTTYSSALLALLFTYDDHDDIILELEEKYAERYEPVQLTIEKKKKKKDKEFKQSPEFVLNNIRKKKLNSEIQKREETLKEQLREMKIKKAMTKQLEQKSLELGINGVGMTSGGNNSSLANNSTFIEGRTLIMKQGSVILDTDTSINPMVKNKENPYRNSILPILLEEEEDREKSAIGGLLKQYRKEIKFYFNTYMTEVNNTITKANVLKLFRDIGIGNDLFNLEELTIAVRNIFGSPLNNFNKEQFQLLIIQLSYLIFIRIKPSLTISESFESCLKLFIIPSEKNKTKEIKRILKILKEKINRGDEEENADENMDEYVDENPDIYTEKDKKSILLPPGFKKILKTNVIYEYRIPSQFANFIPESKIICIEILEELIYKITGSHILEPFVKIKKEYDVILNSSDINNRKWSNSVILAVSNLPKELEPYGKETADLMEEMLKALDKGKETLGKTKIVPPIEKMEMEQYQKYAKESEVKDKKRILRRQILQKELEKKKEEKEEEERKRIEEVKRLKAEKEEKLKKQLLMERELRNKMKRELQLAKEKKEEEKSNKEKEEKEKMDEINKKKEEEKQKFFKKQQRRLKEQFTLIKNVKNEFSKKRIEYLMATKKLPPVNIRKVLDRDKSYVDFEKNLNEKMEELLHSPAISEVFIQYENHFRVIFDIFYKIGSKLSLPTDDVMHMNEFKEFCLNFTILGLLINNEQMIYIFRKICKRNEGEKEERFFLRFNDFVLSILYLCIFAKFTNRSRKIMPSDLQNINANTVKSFLVFLGLKLPFNKRELEDFINDRRALSAKQLSRLQQQIKKDKVGMLKEERTNKEARPKLNNFLRKRENGNKEKNESKFNKEDQKEDDGKDNQKELAEVNVENLQDTKADQLKVVNPSGKPENWELKK